MARVLIIRSLSTRLPPPLPLLTFPLGSCLVVIVPVGHVHMCDWYPPWGFVDRDTDVQWAFRCPYHVYEDLLTFCWKGRREEQHNDKECHTWFIDVSPWAQGHVQIRPNIMLCNGYRAREYV